MDGWIPVVQKLWGKEVDTGSEPGKGDRVREGLALTKAESFPSHCLKLMYFVRTIYSLPKWCHKLCSTDLAGGLPKLVIQPDDLWLLLGLLSGIYGFMANYGATSGPVGGRLPRLTVRLSGPGVTLPAEKAVNYFMFSFWPFGFTFDILKSHVG